MNLKIIGGQTLSGEITPSGSKNSIVSILPATILIKDKITLKNVPNIKDVPVLLTVLEKLGSVIHWDKENKTITLDNTNLDNSNLTKEDLGKMRGSTLLWGAMLGRFTTVSFSEPPTGCTLGVRPIDAHYNAFRDVGVKIEESDMIHMDASHAKAQKFWLTEMSPTATENILMLTTVLSGTTTIIGAASEPSVQDTCNFLNACGARISGIGSSILTIEGVAQLHGCEFEILSDHIEITTFLALSAATGGSLKVHKAMPEHFTAINREFAKFNINIRYEGSTAVLDANQEIKLNSKATTLVRAQPWPALPVDSLPLFIPLALKAKGGTALFHNWMYESGLFWTSELSKFGANVTMCDPHRVMIVAGNKLQGSKSIESPYIIRAAVALTMTALMAEGESYIQNADAAYRGHENFADNLKKLGAQIEVE